MDHISAYSLVNVITNSVEHNAKGQVTERRYTLETLIMTLSTFSVTVDLDIIYAVLSLAKDTQVPVDSIFPHVSRPPHEHYGSLVKFVVEQSSSIDILLCPWAPAPLRGGAGRSSLPSWIPNLTSTAFQRLDSGQWERINPDCLVGRGKKLYRATGNTKAKMIMSRDYLSIYVKGRVVGAVRDVCEYAENGKIPYAWIEEARAVDILVDPQPQSQQPQAHLALSPPVGRRGKRRDYVPDKFWRTIVGNHDEFGGPAPLWYKSECEDCFHQPTGGHTRNVRDNGANTKGLMLRSCATGNIQARKFLQRVQAVTWERSFAVSRDNVYLIVPAKTKTNDKICLLYGCSVPVILRPLGRRCNNIFTLVGECFMHGCMNRELMQGRDDADKAGDRSDKMFTLV